MAVYDRAEAHARVHVGHADKHANAPVGQLLRPLNLVQILRCIVVDRGPEQAAQILRALGGRQFGMRLNRRYLRVGSGGIIRLKAMLDHRGVGRGNKIEVIRVTVRHRFLAPSN